MPDPDQFPEALDSILKKYGKIWIWSNLSAAVAALSVTDRKIRIHAFYCMLGISLLQHLHKQAHSA